MQRDFHYDAIAVLARWAGYSSSDALTIAYASQYVDDADDADPVLVPGGNGLFFDPTMTAYIGIESLTWSLQKRVYIPFHFLPPSKPETLAGYRVADLPPGPLAGFLLTQARRLAPPIIADVPYQDNSRRLARLVNLGINLHVFADQWSHAGFSGRSDLQDNGVEFVEGHVNSEALADLLCYVAPAIGHAKLGRIPDDGAYTWSAGLETYPEEGERRWSRNNASWFCGAADSILRILTGGEQTLTPERGTILLDFLQNHRSSEQFQDLFDAPLVYDSKAWRYVALGAEDLPAPFYRSPGDSASFYKTPWVLWHQAALRHRNMVLEVIQ